MIKLAPAPKTKKVVAESPSENKNIVPIAILLVLVVGFAGYFLVSAMKGRSNGPVSSMQVREGVDAKQVQNVIDRVRQLVDTKADEQPTVATVQDITILRPQNPSLYRDAENGDKLLVWSDKAVVYSVSKDRILVVIPVNPSAQEAVTTPSSAVKEPSVTIEVRNGSATAGAARTLSDALKADGFQMLTPAEAKDKTYPLTVIYNSTGKTIPKTLEKLMLATGATVVTALEGEAPSKADLLIIVGANK